jgi:hypothetical protein
MRKRNAGRKRIDPLILFNMLVLQLFKLLDYPARSVPGSLGG